MLASELRGQRQWWGGDWNSHLGADRYPLCLSTPTVRRSVDDFLPWLNAIPDLSLVDQFLTPKGRGRWTWMHPHNGQWYELDFFLSNCLNHAKTSRFRIIPVPLLIDHRCKEVLVHFTGPARAGPRKFHRCLKQTTTPALKPLRLEGLKGKGDLAREARRVFRMSTEKWLTRSYQENAMTIPVVIGGDRGGLLAEPQLEPAILDVRTLLAEGWDRPRVIDARIDPASYAALLAVTRG